MRRNVPLSRRISAGFTLIETLVALAIIALIASLVMMSFDGSRSKAQALLVTMAELSKANLRMKNDTGCMANDVSALFDYANRGNVFTCGSGVDKTWQGPYMGRVEVADGKMIANSVAEGVEIEFLQSASPSGGKRTTVKATNVPEDIARAALVECNKDPAAVAVGTKPCGGNAAAGELERIVEETR